MHRIFFVLLSITLFNYVNGLSTKFVTAKNLEKIRLDKEGFEKAQLIHYNWYLHSIKAIMGQMGKDLLPSLSPKNRQSFLHCLDVIVDKRDVVTAAKCLIEAKSKSLVLKSNEFLTQRIPLHGNLEMSTSGPRKENKFENPFVQEFRPVNATMQTIMWKNKIGKGRKIIKPEKNSIRHLITNKFSIKSHLLDKFKERIGGLKLRRIMKHRSTANIMDRKRFKRSPYRLIVNRISKSDSQEFVVKNMEKMPYLKSASEKSVIQRVTNLVKTMVKKQNSTNETGRNAKWTDSYKSLLKIKKALDERAKQPGAKVYNMRMFDLVMGNDHPTKAKGEKTLLPPLVHDAYNLIKAFEGNPKVGDASNIKILSPRLAPIMPDKAEVRGHLSPSILSFYKDDTEEQLIPIPKLLESTGMSKSDRESVLEMVMEVSGATQTIGDAIKTLRNMNLFGMELELNEVTERISQIFTGLENTFTEKQQNDMKIRGFTFMETNQIEELHEKQGIKHRSDMDFDINEYGNQTREEREHSLWMRIAEIAANGTKTRSKRKISWVNVLKPTVLSPYMFAPMYGLSVLGPIVLSPSLFSPLILNPSVLSPYVFSPAVGMPFILSPYLLSPYVISPLVMAPFILNPYVLSPNVINPYVLSPLILSPLVICPDVISPMVLGGAILSPGVLSPSVLSKSFLMASVLSPTVLS